MSSVKQDVSLGSFLLGERIGRGTFGDVYRGRHLPSETEVAIKVLRREHARDAEYVQMWKSEARAIARLDHPGIILMLDIGRTDAAAEERSGGAIASDVPYLVMELASRGALSDWLGRLGWRELRPLLLEILDALAHAHARRVIHRDLKPGNILLAGDENSRAGAKLADFGMVDRGAGGTPAYMAPEQFLGENRMYGPWTDLYGLACVAFTIAAGRHPFLGADMEDFAQQHLHEPPPALDRLVEIPRAFSTWLQRNMAKDPLQRFSSSADAAAALAAIEPDAEGAEEIPTRTGPLLAISHAGPIPLDWRRPSPPPPPIRLIGAGLSLFALRELPHVGRERERSRAWRALLETSKGKPGVLLISGPIGVGKSKLARWLVERASELGAAEVVEARFTRVPEPRSGLFGAAADLLHVDTDDENLAEQIEAWLDDHGAPQLSARLLDLLRTGDRTLLAGEEMRHDVLLEVLALRARARPLIFWMEDVHWGIEGIHLAERLMAAGDLPILIVMTIDSDAGRPLEEERARSVSTVELELGPLPPEEERLLLQELLLFEERVAREIARRSAGVPLFAVELVRDLVDRRLLLPSPEGFVLRAAPSIPHELLGLWESRIARATGVLGEESRAALEQAALLGMHVDGSEWRRACGARGIDRALPDALLDRLLTQNLATETRDGFLFVHPMLREAIVTRAREIEPTSLEPSRPKAQGSDWRLWALASVLTVVLGLAAGTRIGRGPEPVLLPPEPDEHLEALPHPSVTARAPEPGSQDAGSKPAKKSMKAIRRPERPPHLAPAAKPSPMARRIDALSSSTDLREFEAVRTEIERAALAIPPDARRRAQGALASAERTRSVEQLRIAWEIVERASNSKQ